MDPDLTELPLMWSLVIIFTVKFDSFLIIQAELSTNTLTSSNLLNIFSYSKECSTNFYLFVVLLIFFFFFKKINFVYHLTNDECVNSKTMSFGCFPNILNMVP